MNVNLSNQGRHRWATLAARSHTRFYTGITTTTLPIHPSLYTARYGGPEVTVLYLTHPSAHYTSRTNTRHGGAGVMLPTLYYML